MTYRAILCLALLSPVVSTAAEPWAERKTAYDTEVKKIDDAYSAATLTALRKYGMSLDILIAKAKENGDLNALLGLRKEKERFDKDRFVPDQQPADVHDSVKRIHTAYLAYRAQALDEANVKKEQLLASYVGSLEALKRSLVSQDKVDEAVRLDAEIQKLQFNLADVRARNPRPAPRPPEPVPDTAPARGGVPPFLRSALILQYSFDKNEGNSIRDLSGKGNDATANGAKHIPNGKRGGAYEFDGANDVIEGASDNSLPTGSAPKTISLWVKPRALGSTMLKYGGDAHLRAQGCCLILCGDFRIWLAGYLTDVMSSGSLTPNAWNHLCMTFDSSKASIYINGTLDVSGAFAQAIPAGTNLEIGHNTLEGNAGYFNGMIDEVLFFDRALSAAEVKQVYDLQK